METLIWLLIFLFLFLVPVRVETSAQTLAQAVPDDCPLPVYDASLLDEHAFDESVYDAINASLSDDQRLSQLVQSDDGVFMAYVVLTPTEPHDDGRPAKPMYEGEDPRFRNPLVEIRAYHVESDEWRTLVDNDTLLTLREEPIDVSPRVMNLQWVPDSHVLSFNSGAYAYGDGIFESIADDLWLLAAASGELTNLLPQGEGGVAVWSPEGAHAAVMGRDVLKLVSVTGELVGEDLLPEYEAIGLGHTLGYPALIWEDADSFLITSTDDSYSQYDPTLTLWRVFVDASEPEIVGQFTAFFFSFNISPDLERVVYWRTPREGSNQRTIYVNTLSGDDEQAWGGGESGLIDTGAWVDPLHFRYTVYIENELGTEPAHFIADVCGQLFPVA